MWKSICEFGKVCSDCLAGEDIQQIEKVKNAYQESENLKGYCPEKRSAIMARCADELDHNKYSLGYVSEHYGIGWYTLRKYIPDEKQS